MSEKGLRIEIPVHIKRDRWSRRVLGKEMAPKAALPVSRIARLLALAHKWEGMVQRGEVTYAEIARAMRLTRARVAQISSLALLAPNIQNVLLDSTLEREPFRGCSLRDLAVQVHWSRQQKEWLRNADRA